MSSFWPWLAVAGAGALHGLNPATGWMFAAAQGVQSRDRAQALRALVPIAAKIDRIGQVVRAAGGAFLGAYAAIYAVSSEVIHGSVYGMSLFMSAHGPEEPTIDTFLASTEEQMIDILSAAGHAASGFIAAFANVHKFGPLVLDEHELFKRLIKAATGEDWVGGDSPD